MSLGYYNMTTESRSPWAAGTPEEKTAYCLRQKGRYSRWAREAQAAGDMDSAETFSNEARKWAVRIHHIEAGKL